MTSMHSAIKMLISRVELLHQLLLKMQSGGRAGHAGPLPPARVPECACVCVRSASGSVGACDVA